MASEYELDSVALEFLREAFNNKDYKGTFALCRQTLLETAASCAKEGRDPICFTVALLTLAQDVAIRSIKFTPAIDKETQIAVVKRLSDILIDGCVELQGEAELEEMPNVLH